MLNYSIVWSYEMTGTAKMCRSHAKSFECIFSDVWESSWNVMAHGDVREMGWEVKGKLANGVGSQYSSHYLGTWCVSSITTADAHTSAASSRLNLRPLRFKWTRPFRRKTKYGFCACAITFQLASTYIDCFEIRAGRLGTASLCVDWRRILTVMFDVRL
jgi:hypothetical protein